jgi:hypothetical protein
MNLSKQLERNVLMRTQNVQLLLNTLKTILPRWQRRMRRLLLPTILLLVPNSRVATVLISFVLKEKLGQIQIPITMYDRTSEQPFYCYADTYYYFRRKQILWQLCTCSAS